MRRLTWKLREMLRSLSARRVGLRRQHLPVVSAINLETLEPRSLPTGNASGAITGLAFIDANVDGDRDTGEVTVRGVPVRLTGTTSQGTSINVTTTTTTSGSYTFENVLPGTYRLTSGPAQNLVGGAVTGSAFTVAGGQTVTRDLPLGGIVPEAISLRMFLTTTTPESFATDAGFATAGTTAGLANERENNLPELANGPMTFDLGKGDASTIVDLASVFTDPDMTNSQVTFQTSLGDINVELFDSDTPQTVANFFNYVNDDRYDDSVFHRVISGFVAQGGGFQVDGDGIQTEIPADPPVENEFGVSNTRGTIALAKVGGLAISSATQSDTTVTITTLASLSLTRGTTVIIENVGVAGYNGTFTIDSIISPTQFTYTSPNTGLAASSGGTVSLPNSATSEFFFNLVDNSGNLNNQNGGFTVFGEVVAAADLAVMDAVGASGINLVTVSDISIVRRDEFLSYSVVSNTNDSLVTTSIVNNRLTLSHTPGTTGTAQITIRATDRYGATLDATFPVSIDNLAPSATVRLSPLAPLADATLTATATTRDLDGDAVTLSYVWTVNGSVVQETEDTTALTDTFDLSDLATPPQPGDIVRVAVTPNDGEEDGTTRTATTQINRVPIVNSVELSSESPTTNSVLTATVEASDADNDPIALTYIWKVNGIVVQTTLSSMSPTNSLDLSLAGQGDLGDQITVEVTPSDGKETGATVSASVMVVNSAPVVDSVDVTPSNPSGTDTLTATVMVSDDDGNTVTVSYVWKVNGNVVRTTSSTSSLTDMLDLAALGAISTGDEVTVEVTPNDGTVNGLTVTELTRIG
jgi:cyclophilin family peptidyl-prolyl cis-trans isomerase